MSNFPSDTYTFGAAAYRPAIDSLQLRTPIPRAAPVGDWVHVPWGNNNKWETDGGRTPTSWTLRIILPTAADYTTMAGYLGTFQTLTSDFGTFSAILRTLSDAQLHGAGHYQATATFEWS